MGVAATGEEVAGMAGLGPEIDVDQGLDPQHADQEDLPATDPWRDADLLVVTGAEIGIHLEAGTETAQGAEIEMDPQTGKDQGTVVHPGKGRGLTGEETNLDLGPDPRNLVSGGFLD